MSASAWRPFGIADEDYGPTGPDGVRVVNLKLRGGESNRRDPADRAVRWLRGAMIGLGVLSGAAAAVSFAAQYRMVYSARHLTVIAALEAGIPDAAALIFACLGIALALHGKHAIRARLLNAGAVATSIVMNALAAGHGWRDAAIWVMPPIAYALASDTAIGVIRAWTLARQRAAGERLADDEQTPLALVGTALLWLLRLALAAPSTLTGFRAWVVTEVAPAPQPRALAVAVEAADQARAIADRVNAEAEAARQEVNRLTSERDEISQIAAQQLAAARQQAGADSALLQEALDAAARRLNTLAQDLSTATAQARDSQRVAQEAERDAAALRSDWKRQETQNREAWDRVRDLEQQLTQERTYWTGRLEEAIGREQAALEAARGGTKSNQLIALAVERYGPLAGIPVDSTARIAAELAPQVDLHAGSARTVLRARVQAAQNGGQS